MLLCNGEKNATGRYRHFLGLGFILGSASPLEMKVAEIGHRLDVPQGSCLLEPLLRLEGWKLLPPHTLLYTAPLSVLERDGNNWKGLKYSYLNAGPDSGPGLLKCFEKCLKTFQIYSREQMHHPTFETVMHRPGPFDSLSYSQILLASTNLCVPPGLVRTNRGSCSRL